MTEPTTQDAPPLTTALRRLVLAVLDYSPREDHDWRCEYRTAEVGWKHGEPPVIRCECGFDELGRAVRDASDALAATEGAESREGLDPETVRGALIRSGLVWVIPAKDFDEAVQVVTRELANGPLALRDPS